MGYSATIHVVDDDASFRASVSELLGACGYRVCVHESAATLLKTPPADEPACVLLDVRLPGLSGPQLQQRLQGLGSSLPIIFISGYTDIPTTVRTIKAGAEDFLTKPVPKERLLEAIGRALVRYENTREATTRVANLRARVALLTPRENEVFELLVRGKPHKQISNELRMSERTVKMHRRHVIDKLNVRSLAELAVIAERTGLLREDQLSEQEAAATETAPGDKGTVDRR